MQMDGRIILGLVWQQAMICFPTTAEGKEGEEMRGEERKEEGEEREMRRKGEECDDATTLSQAMQITKEQ